MTETVSLNLRWQDQKIVRVEGQWIVDGHPLSKREVVYHHQPSNIPGMSYVGVKSVFPIGAAVPPHRHGGAAVTVNVVRGRIVNQMVCGGKILGPVIHDVGDSWYEPPGCHHVRCENAGNEEAIFVANFVIETWKVEKFGVVNALVQVDADEDSKRGTEERDEKKLGSEAELCVWATVEGL